MASVIPFENLQLVPIDTVGIGDGENAANGSMPWSQVALIGRGRIARDQPVFFAIDPEGTGFFQFALCSEQGELLDDHSEISDRAWLVIRRASGSGEPAIEGNLRLTISRHVGWHSSQGRAQHIVIPYQLTTQRLPEPTVTEPLAGKVTIGTENLTAAHNGLIALGTLAIAEPTSRARYLMGGRLVIEASATLAISGGAPTPIGLYLSITSERMPGDTRGTTVGPTAGSKVETVASMPYPVWEGVVRRIGFGVALSEVFARFDLVVQQIESEVSIAWNVSHVGHDGKRTEVARSRFAPRLIVEGTSVLSVRVDGVGKVSLPLSEKGSAHTILPGILLRLGQPGTNSVRAIPEAIGVQISHALAHIAPTVEAQFCLREGVPPRDLASEGNTSSIQLSEPRNLTLRLRDILARSKAIAAFAESSWGGQPAGETAVVINLTQHAPNGTKLVGSVILPVILETPPPPLLICVDLGTSATAAWFGPTRSIGAPIRPVHLPLGELVRDLTGDLHEEFDPELRPAENVLLPSIVGLDPAMNMRARFAPLSYGDTRLAFRDHAGAAERLAALGRRYDVSVPFVPRQEIPAYQDAIVREPKREMMRQIEAGGARDRLVLGREVPSFENGKSYGTRKVDFGALFGDVFHELGDFLLPRALRLADAQLSAEGRRSDSASDDGPFVKAWLDRQFRIGAVATHPSGIPAAVRERYRSAVERFHAAFTGEAAPAPWIKLVPEAVAAAFYGIDSLLKQGMSPGRAVFATLDIGAGTCDATLIDATIAADAQSKRLYVAEWHICSHFGVIVGGRDLDAAIEAAVWDVLAGMTKNEDFADLKITLDLGEAQLAAAAGDTPTTRFARNLAFRDAIQDAKRQLSAKLLASSTDPFIWDANGPKLRVEVGREPDDGIRLVRRAHPRRLEGTGKVGDVVVIERRPVDRGGSVHLVFEGTFEEERRVRDLRIILEMDPLFFATRRTEEDARARGRRDPRAVVDLLGRVMPKLLAREAKRQHLPNPQWIVTGRAALWPPLFEAIGEIANALGGQPPPRPFAPAEMKQAVLRGAMALAIDARLPLGDDVPKVMAMLDEVTIAADSGTVGMRELSAIRYVENSEKAVGSARVAWHDNSRLVHIFPGLALDVTTGDPDLDAIALLDLFDVPYQRELAQRISHTVGEVPIAWSWHGDVTDVDIGGEAVRAAGDGRSA